MSRWGWLLFLGGTARQVLSGIARGGIHDWLLHTHILGIDYTRLVGHIWIAGRGVDMLRTWLVHHCSGCIGSLGVDLRGHTIGGSWHICGHGIVLHLSGINGAALDGADVILLGVVARDYIDQKVEDICLLNGSRNIGSLQSSALGLLGLCPCAVSELQNEHLTGFGEKDGSLGGDHANILITFHDLLDACEREEMIFEIGGLLDLGHLLDPKCVEFSGEFLKIVLLLQLCLTGLLLHKLILSGSSHLIVSNGLRGDGWRRGSGGGAGRRVCVIGHGGRR